ncbi:hypothetical protein, partial [Microvirga aerophila]|uniref:hypothetical protein n=1 Tax=Microvirga aerophila TaxID=670291 RepID=UPI001AEE5A36
SRLSVLVLKTDQGGNGRFWHPFDLSSKAAIFIEADVPKTHGISAPDPTRTFQLLNKANDLDW